MNVRIASCPDSWGVWFPSDDRQIPWRRFMDEIVEAGYDGTELGPWGYLPTDVAALKHELESRGLTAIGSFVEGRYDVPDGWPHLEKQLRGLGPVMNALGAEYLNLIHQTYSDPRTGELTASRELGTEGWRHLVATMTKLAKIARQDYGLTPLVHAESNSHLEFEHQIEALMDETDPALLGFCLDIGHHAYRGGDPITFMRKHHDRIHYLHLKNVSAAIVDVVTADDVPFGKAVEMGVFCEPAEGVIDYEAFRDVLREIDYQGWATVEQDMYPATFDKPLPIAKRTRTYLRDIGLG